MRLLIPFGYLSVFGETGADENAKNAAFREALFKEVAVLTEMTYERRIREVEIYDQIDSFLDHFSNMLKLTQRHLNMQRLMVAADRIGLKVAMYLKEKYAFPRPNQVYPFLVPMIPVPMHPSWPSGHATEAYMVAEAIGAAVKAALQPKVAEGKMSEDMRDAVIAQYLEPARFLARRIAQNREVAGVHYQDDSEAGRLIARRVIQLLTDGGNPLFDKLLAAAGAELLSTHQPIGGDLPGDLSTFIAKLTAEIEAQKAKHEKPESIADKEK